MKMNKTPIGSSERGNGKKSHEEEDTSHLRVLRDSETKEIDFKDEGIFTETLSLRNRRGKAKSVRL